MSVFVFVFVSVSVSVCVCKLACAPVDVTSLTSVTATSKLLRLGPCPDMFPIFTTRSHYVHYVSFQHQRQLSPILLYIYRYIYMYLIYIYMYLIYIYICMCVCVYIYIYIGLPPRVSIEKRKIKKV